MMYTFQHCQKKFGTLSETTYCISFNLRGLYITVHLVCTFTFMDVCLFQLHAKQCSLKQNFPISLNHSLTHTHKQKPKDNMLAGW